MPKFQLKTTVQQLGPRKGGYYYLEVEAEVIEQFEKKRKTRLLCIVDGHLNMSCGLNHLGNGNYFIILSAKNLKKLKKQLGEAVEFQIEEHPNPLGVEIPEVLEVLLEQDEAAKSIFDQLTDGRKRTLIFMILRVKNIDLQIQKTLDFLEVEAEKINQKKRKQAKG